MQYLPILITVAGFTLMGIGAIAKPAFVTAQFGIFDLTLTVARAPRTRSRLLWRMGFERAI